MVFQLRLGRYIAHYNAPKYALGSDREYSSDFWNESLSSMICKMATIYAFSQVLRFEEKWIQKIENDERHEGVDEGST